MSTGPFCTSVLYMLQQPPQRCKLLAIGCDETLEIYFVDDDENEYMEDAVRGSGLPLRCSRPEEADARWSG